jgi:hypothetical protein
VVNGWMDRWMDGWMDAWTDGKRRRCRTRGTAQNVEYVCMDVPVSEPDGTDRRRAGGVVLERTRTRCARKREPAAGVWPFPTMSATPPRMASPLREAARSRVRRMGAVVVLLLPLLLLQAGGLVGRGARSPAPVAAPLVAVHGCIVVVEYRTPFLGGGCVLCYVGGVGQRGGLD